MNAIQTLTFGLLGAWVLFQLLRVLGTSGVLLRMRLDDATIQIDEAEDGPEIAAPLKDELLALGFVRQGRMRTAGPVFAGPPDPRPTWSYYRAEGGVYAWIIETELPHGGSPYTVVLRTPTADGRRLETYNGMAHMVIGQVPDAVQGDALALDLAGHLAYHERAWARLGAPAAPGPVSLPELVAIAHTQLHAYLKGLRDAGWLSPDPAGGWRLKSMAAFQTALKIVGRLRAIERWRKQREALAPPPVGATLVEGEVAAYRRFFALKAQERGRLGRLWLFLVSLGVFMLAAPLLGLGDSPWNVVWLVAVLLLHELGHFLGMWAFGYQDLHIVFLPLLGAVTRGTPPPNSGSLARALVYLLGPVPGMALGLGLWAGHYGDLLPAGETLVIFLLVINWINLLPLLPLDGGQLLRTTLFVRWPSMQLALTVASGLVLIAAPVLEPSLGATIAPLGLLVLVSVPTQWRSLRLRRALGPDILAAAQPDRERLAFEALHAPGFGRTRVGQRLWLVRRTLEQLDEPRPRFLGLATSLMLYGAALGLPLFLLVVHAFALVMGDPASLK